MDFGKVLGTLASFFEREGYRYAAIGAFGLHAYGLARATLDLDLATESAAQSKLVAFVESLGYETLYRSAGYSHHVHTPARSRAPRLRLRGPRDGQPPVQRRGNPAAR